MPCNSMKEARDEMLRMAVASFPGVKIFFQGKEGQNPAGTNEQWLHIEIFHELGFQEALADKDSKRRYNRSGVIVIQCFGPLSDRGFAKAQTLAESAVQTYQGKQGAGGIWFRNCRAREIGASTAWYQFNTNIDFTYTQFS